MIWKLKELMKSASQVQYKTNEKWEPSRPLSGSLQEKIKGAWLVLTGKADAVVWTDQHEWAFPCAECQAIIDCEHKNEDNLPSWDN